MSRHIRIIAIIAVSLVSFCVFSAISHKAKAAAGNTVLRTIAPGIVSPVFFPSLHAQEVQKFFTPASTLTVTSNADSGAGTLRNQIAAANSGDTINIQAGLATIDLSTVGDNTYGPSALLINKNLTINGNGATIQ